MSDGERAIGNGENWGAINEIGRNEEAQGGENGTSGKDDYSTLSLRLPNKNHGHRRFRGRPPVYKIRACLADRS